MAVYVKLWKPIGQFLQNGWTILHAHQQCVRVPIVPQAHTWEWSTSAVGHSGGSEVAFYCCFDLFSLMNADVGYHCVYRSFVYLFWEHVNLFACILIALSCFSHVKTFLIYKFWIQVTYKKQFDYPYALGFLFSLLWCYSMFFLYLGVVLWIYL